ncbi:MAG: molecular chaperone HtpG [Promethearchaeota archaeon]
MSDPQSTYEFKAEIKKLLDILSKSLYVHREIFLRELISNSVDALRKVQFLVLQDSDVVDRDAELRVDVLFDAKAGTLTVSDTGVGMTRQELVENLGTIAGSGSQRFLENLSQATGSGEKEVDLEIIGQFGVGFYSVFMVAEKVKVVSKSYLPNEPAAAWESEGTGTFVVSDAERDGRGTDVVLFLRDDAKEFLNQYRLEEVVRKYSNFVPFPVFVSSLKPDREEVDVGEPAGEEGGEPGVSAEAGADSSEAKEKPVNQTVPPWSKSPSDITEDEYRQLFRYLSRFYGNYLHAINYKVEGGRLSFRSILFLPESSSLDLFQRDYEYGLALYSKNVLIMERSKDVVPTWLRFLVGVVDSEDLPLNISRESVQADRVLNKISELVVKKVLRELSKIAKDDPEKYNRFWREFGVFIKEGIVTDLLRRDKLVPLLRVKTTKTSGDEMISLDDYVGRMKPGQSEIFYLVGENVESMRLSPHLGYYDREGVEVVLFDEPIDNFLMMNLRSYSPEDSGEEKKTYAFKPVDVTEEEDGAKSATEGEDQEANEGGKERDADLPAEQRKFLEYARKTLGARVLDVRMSDKLYGAACRLANPSGGMTSSMQRAMRYWTQTTRTKDFQAPRKILEFNPDHPIVTNLVRLASDDPDNKKLRAVVHQLLDNCLLAEGDLPNPASIVPRVNQIIEMLVTGRDDVDNPAEVETDATTPDEAEKGEEVKGAPEPESREE